MQAALRSHLLPAPAAPAARCALPRARPFVARHFKGAAPRSSAAGAEPAPEQPARPPAASPATGGGVIGWWKAQQAKSAELRKKLVALGPAAVLAYGLFDGISYTIAFTIAFLSYEAQTGMNPTQNVADIVKIMLLMWAGNNVTRPFRLAGAAALAPFMDRVMNKLVARLNLPNKAYAFAIVTAAVAGACFSVLGALFLSRWVVG